MGGCVSKPRVVVKEADDEHNAAPGAVAARSNSNNEVVSISIPESDHHQPQAADHEEDEAGRRVSVMFHEIIHMDLDHQYSNKRPSLSYLFHQSEDEKSKTRSENKEGEENLKEEEALEKEVKRSNNNEMNEGMKVQESQVKEAAEKCEGNGSEQKLQEEAKASAKLSEVIRGSI